MKSVRIAPQVYLIHIGPNVYTIYKDGPLWIAKKDGHVCDCATRKAELLRSLEESAISM